MCASAGLVVAKSEFSLWECLTPTFAISAFEFGRVWAPALANVSVCDRSCLWVSGLYLGMVTRRQRHVPVFVAAPVAKIGGFTLRAHS